MGPGKEEGVEEGERLEMQNSLSVLGVGAQEWEGCVRCLLHTKRIPCGWTQPPTP